jgi:type IV pilus assembly protein PilA
MSNARRLNRSAGFTLVEIIIVVVILAILATIVIAQLRNLDEGAEHSVFVTNLKSFAGAAALYRAQTGDLVVDGSSGQVPSGFEDYIDTVEWTAGTPIGGVWDTEANSLGFQSLVGVHFNSGSPKSDEYMTKVDALLDDGDLNTGGFRKLANDRFYFIVVE